MFFDGEIYNKSDLGLGDNDYDVIVAAYQRWGVSGFSKLRGAFAAEIHDGDKILLVRDQFGTYPFYYYVDAEVGGIAASTSVRALLDMGVPRKLSKEGLCSFIVFGNIQRPWTMVEGVKCVPPASCVIYNKLTGSVEIQEYWFPDFTVKNWKEPELNEAITATLYNSVKRQVEYGGDPSSFLSGGLDSTAVAIMMRKMGANKNVRTYCIVNDNPKYDERQWAKLVADRNHMNHHDLLLDGSMISKHLDEAVASYDQPSMDGLNFWFGFKLIKEAGESVILSGEGGDEFFLSEIYKQLLVYRIDKYVRWMPQCLGHLVERFAPNEKFRKLGQMMGRKMPPYFIIWRVFSEMRVRNLLRDELVDFNGVNHPDEVCHGATTDIYNFLSWMEMRHPLVNMYQRDGFQTSRAHGVKMRMPIIDVDLAQLLLSVPGAYKYDTKIMKPCLVRACGDMLPPEIATRTKQGFSLPFKDYFNGELKDKLDAFLMAGDTKLFKPEAIRELGRQFYAGKVYWSNIWIPFMAENWCRQNKIEL